MIIEFADDSGHTPQEFYTNRTLIHLMAQMLEPRPGESIYDPTCGTGGTLISCLAKVKRRGGDIRTTGLNGQEVITITAAIARMNLVIHWRGRFSHRQWQHAWPRPPLCTAKASHLRRGPRQSALFDQEY